MDQQKKTQKASWTDMINEKCKLFGSWAAVHKGDTLAYAVLLIGLILSLIKPWVGHGLVGIVVGIYFAAPVIFWVRNYSEVIEKNWPSKLVALVGALLFLLIVAPMFLVGVALSAAFRVLFPE